MNGRPLALQWLADSVPAMLETWYLGSEHGPATADVLFGDYNPGGHLPAGFPRVTGQVPLTYDRRPTGRPPSDTGAYRMQYVDVHWTPLFPFGHGLSYTRFAHRDLRLLPRRARTGDSVIVEVEVANEGSRGGDAVVQLYVRDDVASVARPVRMLRGFERVSLGPGARRTVRFALRPEHLALYDIDLRRVVEPGTFTIYVGDSSVGGLEAKLEIVGDTMVVEEERRGSRLGTRRP
jgi:beta-glucosidase